MDQLREHGDRLSALLAKAEGIISKFAVPCDVNLNSITLQLARHHSHWRIVVIDSELEAARGTQFLTEAPLRTKIKATGLIKALFIKARDSRQGLAGASRLAADHLEEVVNEMEGPAPLNSEA